MESVDQRFDCLVATTRIGNLCNESFSLVFLSCLSSHDRSLSNGVLPALGDCLSSLYFSRLRSSLISFCISYYSCLHPSLISFCLLIFSCLRSSLISFSTSCADSYVSPALVRLSFISLARARLASLSVSHFLSLALSHLFLEFRRFHFSPAPDSQFSLAPV